MSDDKNFRRLDKTDSDFKRDINMSNNLSSNTGLGSAKDNREGKDINTLSRNTGNEINRSGGDNWSKKETDFTSDKK
ncbi:hypothetical protein ABK040_009068 [Willaertia magna]